jgi:hypothetical protein
MICNEELRKLYPSPNIIRINKSKRVRWPGHVTRMGRRVMRIVLRCESQKEVDLEVDVDKRGRIILKWILEK